MELNKIEYIKCNSYETEIEKFWVDFKSNLLKKNYDTTLIEFKIERNFEGAVSGEFAGILITIMMSLPGCTLATIELWEKLQKHLKNNREKKRLPRILNMKMLENLCRLELFQRGLKKFDLIESKKLIQNFEKNEDNHYSSNTDFEYCDDAYKTNVASFIFESHRYIYTFIVDNDGEITNFKKSKKN